MCTISVADVKVCYPNLFEGIGQLKDFEPQPHVDKSVPPVAQQLKEFLSVYHQLLTQY